MVSLPSWSRPAEQTLKDRAQGSSMPAATTADVGSISSRGGG
ncbi:MAG: hypothetical protein R2702_19535 [Acidimicrobiales bacterium]